MAGLVIAAQNLEVTQFTELPPRVRGEITPSFNNTMRSSVSSEKRMFQAVTAPVNNTLYSAIKAAIANGATVTVAGDVLRGASLSCKVTVSYELVGIGTADAGYNFVFVLHLDIAEA